MSPILGIWASAQQPALNATSFESIATVTVGAGGSAYAEFTSIPSTYTHLQIRSIAKSSTTAGRIDIQFNSDTGTNYANHFLDGTGSSVSAGAETSNGKISIYYLMTASTNANMFSGGVIDILDYKNTNKYKTLRALVGNDQNGSGDITLQSGLWQNTNAITSIKLTPQTGNLAQYSSFALYGIKA